eukprot:3967265-Pyramimonas_sp.AAC.1
MIACATNWCWPRSLSAHPWPMICHAGRCADLRSASSDNPNKEHRAGHESERAHVEILQTTAGPKNSELSRSTGLLL